MYIEMYKVSPVFICCVYNEIQGKYLWNYVLNPECYYHCNIYIHTKVFLLICAQSA
jgi:hypothetical protein